MSIGILYPLFCIIIEAAQWPVFMHSSNFFPLINLDKNPPSKASPAPLVSTIFSLGTFSTGNKSQKISFSIFKSYWHMASGFGPAVIMTILFLFLFFLEYFYISDNLNLLLYSFYFLYLFLIFGKIFLLQIHSRK